MSNVIRLCYTCECELHEFSESGSRQGQCRACTAAYFREHRKRPDVKIKDYARKKANDKLNAGVIVKTPCVLCGGESDEMHHPDYTRPTDISWLCNPCHDEYHSLERKVFKK